MKLILAVLVVFLVVGTQAQWYRFPGDWRDTWPDRDIWLTNWRNSDKYVHARGNHDAANRGPRGRWASRVISDGREALQALSRHGNSDSAADQEANRWGRNGGDPNRYRPSGLPEEY